jgi:regulator of protease activity HflC (stomatin/prohibitin superfamily)
MFDKIIDFLLNFLDQLLPFVIIKSGNRGVWLRFGIYRKDVPPGLHFKIPFVDEIQPHGVVFTTITLPPQSIVTKDGICVVIRAHIKYRIEDLKTYAIDVYDAVDALSDMTGGIIFEQIKTQTWEEAYSADLPTILTKKSKVEAKKWGFHIEKVTITDFSKMTSLRLFSGDEILK